MEAADFSSLIAAASGFFGALVGAGAALLAQRYSLIATRAADERRLIVEQLDRFLIPYATLARANFTLAADLRRRLGYEERFLVKIFDKSWITSLADGDRAIVKVICDNAAKLESYIEERMSFVDNGLAKKFSAALVHYRVLTMAAAGELGTDPTPFQTYSYPRDLDEAVDKEIDRLSTELKKPI